MRVGVRACVCVCVGWGVEHGLLFGCESVCVSGGAIKHSLAMMDVRVGVSGQTLVEAA